MRSAIKWSEFLISESRKHKVPFFMIGNKEIGIIESAAEFYTLLIKGIRESRFRINLSTLYIGGGPMEEFLVREIVAASNRNQQLKVSVIVDRNRGQRGGNVGGPSSEQLFQNMKGLALNPENLTLSLFQHNSLGRKSLLAPTSGAREVFGTYHAKHYIFDDTVILSGANLSEEYFTTRYDRYIYINEDKELCDFLDDFDRVCIDSGDRVVSASETQIGWKQPSELVEGLQRRFSVFLHNSYSEKSTNALLASLVLPSQKQPQTDDFEANRLFADKIAKDFKSAKSVEAVAQACRDSINYYDNKYRLYAVRSDSGKSLLFPSFQMALVDYRVEEQLIAQLLTLLIQSDPSQQYSLSFTTGYFNPSDQLLSLLNRVPPNLKVDILTAAPNANSFFRAKGLKGYIPSMYRIALLKWIKQLQGSPNVKFWEFTKEGSTYHSKGLWLKAVGQQSAEYLTVYGSSNFSNRSFQKDLENQFYIVTSDQEKIGIFEREREALWRHARPITVEAIEGDKETRTGIVERTLFRLFRNSL